MRAELLARDLLHSRPTASLNFIVRHECKMAHKLARTDPHELWG